jgi:hypothetical protein
METIPQTEKYLRGFVGRTSASRRQNKPFCGAVNTRRYLSSSGAHWRDGITVPAAHTIRPTTDDILVILPNGQTVAARFTRVIQLPISPW